jgi:hypothetical protein
VREIGDGPAGSINFEVWNLKTNIRNKRYFTMMPPASTMETITAADDSLPLPGLRTAAILSLI